MQQNNTNQSGMVPEAKAALDNMKFEIARELGINFKQGYNGDLSSRENGYVGGYMVNLLLPAERIRPILHRSRFSYARTFIRNHKKIQIEYTARFFMGL